MTQDVRTRTQLLGELRNLNYMERIEEAITKIMYKASDGQTFDSERSCLRHEASNEYTVLKEKYNRVGKTFPIQEVYMVSGLQPSGLTRQDLRILESIIDGYFDSLSGFGTIFRVSISDKEDKSVVELFYRMHRPMDPMFDFEIGKDYLLGVNGGTMFDGIASLSIVSLDELTDKITGILKSLKNK